MVTFGGSIAHIANSTFDHNLGSVYTFSSNLTFSGYIRFKNSMEPPNKTQDVATRQEGGAITSYQSRVLFTGVSILLNNRARHGGAILATESTITMYGETTIANNMATNSDGGGVHLHQSDIDVKGSCIISQNHAMRGGGIHASSSSITVYQQGTLQLSNNGAEYGGGTYLEVNPRFYVLKTEPSYMYPRNELQDENLLIFSGNHANYGGAVYVADDTNSGACSPNTECFIQTLALHQMAGNYLSTANVIFSGNTATEHGSNLFGGLLDRCVPSPFAEVYLKYDPFAKAYYRAQYDGVSYLENISNITSDSITSLPVRVCFCNSEGQPDCSYQPAPIKVKKGEAFTMSLVAVDQVNHSVDANITSSLSSPDSGFDEGQQIQKVNKNCTDLTFNVFASNDSEIIKLFADGPCGSSTLSVQHVNIQFLNCACPVGFEVDSSRSTRCECNCHFALSPYITNCDHTTSSLLRVDTNSWITYINDTDPSGYVIHNYCPFDYCHPPTENVSINLNLPNGADAQCAYNHRGVLCGACQENLSLSLGSSRCLPCDSHWPAVFVAILVAAIIAGVLLVITLLTLNMTVAVGLINGVIFYANIIAANNSIVFLTTEPSFFTVIIAWLNLDIGFDACFFNGLDAYTKTWLQLAFPAYVISLVVLVIKISEHSPRFTRLIGPGRRDPVATLATLTLLSYAKLLSVTIAVLSFAVLHYPDGSKQVVWLLDGNVMYFQGKHIVLVFVATLIILIGVPYTFLLFFWQWLIQTPNGRLFRWTKNTKLNAIITTYHAPYNYEHRYWTGLLLLVRVVLYITAAVTVSSNPQVPLLTIIILVGGLLFLKGIYGRRVYKRSSVDIVETVILLNLLSFAAFSLYEYKTDSTKQVTIAYISTITTLSVLVGSVVYHVILLIKRKRTPVEQDEYTLLPLNQHFATPPPCEVTYSIIEIPKSQSPPNEPSNNSETVSEDRIDGQNKSEDHAMDPEDDNATA